MANTCSLDFPEGNVTSRDCVWYIFLSRSHVAHPGIRLVTRLKGIVLRLRFFQFLLPIFQS
jgi:hypothetical protein